jgi:hypothetical protein
LHRERDPGAAPTQPEKPADATPKPGEPVKYPGKLSLNEIGIIIVRAYRRYIPSKPKGFNSPRKVKQRTVVLDHEAFVRKYCGGEPTPEGRADAEGCPGFYHPEDDRIYVDASQPDVDSTIMHEALHMYASKEWRAQVRTAMDEGVTETLARLLITAKQKEKPGLGLQYYGGYGNTRTAAWDMMKKVAPKPKPPDNPDPEDPVLKAYFSGDVDQLKTAYRKRSPAPTTPTEDAWEDNCARHRRSLRQDIPHKTQDLPDSEI